MLILSEPSDTSECLSLSLPLMLSSQKPCVERDIVILPQDTKWLSILSEISTQLSGGALILTQVVWLQGPSADVPDLTISCLWGC